KSISIRTVAKTIGFVALVSLPYWIGVFKLMKFQGYETFAWRNGLFLKEHGLYLLPHRTIWFFILPAFLLLKNKAKGLRFLGAFSLAGALCYFSTLITGISLQNFHWHFTMAPFLFAAMFWFVSNKIPSRWKHQAAVV